MSYSRLPMALLFASVIIMVAFFPIADCKKYLRPNQCISNQLRCGLCGRSINVTIIARNVFTDPKFEYQVQVIRQPRRPLVYFLEKAADLNGAFNFSASYHGKLGYMVNSISGLTANVTGKTYWNIASVTNGNSGLLCGVSTYVPNQSEVLLFNFTTWATGVDE